MTDWSDRLANQSGKEEATPRVPVKVRVADRVSLGGSKKARRTSKVHSSSSKKLPLWGRDERFAASLAAASCLNEDVLNVVKKNCLGRA